MPEAVPPFHRKESLVSLLDCSFEQHCEVLVGLLVTEAGTNDSPWDCLCRRPLDIGPSRWSQSKQNQPQEASGQS